MHTKDSIPSLAIALYVGIGLLIGLVGTGLFYEVCRDKGTLEPSGYLVEATVLNCLDLGKPFLISASVLLFVIVFASLKLRHRGRLIEVIFPTLAFVIVFVMWFVRDLVFHGKLGWTGFLHALFLGGISAMSLGILLDHRRLYDSIDSMLILPVSSKDDKNFKLK